MAYYNIFSPFFIDSSTEELRLLICEKQIYKSKTNTVMIFRWSVLINLLLELVIVSFEFANYKKSSVLRRSLGIDVTLGLPWIKKHQHEKFYYPMKINFKEPSGLDFEVYNAKINSKIKIRTNFNDYYSNSDYQNEICKELNEVIKDEKKITVPSRNNLRNI
ncbi:hypothetical protein H8356DRAFT_1342450 [Neocallimastix lanati (nom. inval.)]|nr:hypothetical protein H8356DRAFT_1342450 [Neocallimastix sp. JGI-2020a]